MSTQLDTSEELLQTLVTGLSSNSSTSASAGGYLGQVADSKARLAAAETEEEQARTRLGMIEKELKEKTAKWKAVEREAGDGKNSLERGRKEVESLKRKLVGTGWSVEREEQSALQLRDAKEAYRTANEVRKNHLHLMCRSLHINSSAAMLSKAGLGISTFRTQILLSIYRSSVAVCRRSRYQQQRCRVCLRRKLRGRSNMNEMTLGVR